MSFIRDSYMYSVETKIEDGAFSLFYREAAGVNSVSSKGQWFNGMSV